MRVYNTIKTLRTQAGISQEQMADLLAMSRITYTHIESGKRELKTSEIEKIAQFFEVTPLELMHTRPVSRKIEIRMPQTKMMNIILYILSKCAGKPNLGKIVMNKLLYFIDFNYHEKYHESLTEATYIKMPMGPVPKDGEELFQQMKDE
ncbi:helix-turn-helix domain-containing protein [Patescibacteria group bacterium]|nr:helix-turn-helix domain-containing protein [Patescibacteria group bacterium]